MLEKLHITNFRMHQEQEIEFAPDITTIIGSSASGKSTLLKSIIWILQNRPAGDSVINWDAEKAVGRLTIDGNLIKRIKGKNTNLYKLNKKKFVAFGKGEVPSEIEKLLNISDINIQTQFEPHFWFSKTAGEVSRQLNQIVNMDVIDSTMANIASEVRRTSSEIDVIQERLTTIKKQRTELLYAKEMDERLKIVENKYNLYQKYALEAFEINELVQRAITYGQTIENSKQVAKQGNLAIIKWQLYLDVKTKQDELSNLIKNAELLQKQTAVKLPPLDLLEKLWKEYKNLQEQRLSIEELIENIDNTQKNVTKLKISLSQSEKELEKRMGKICPLCGQMIKK
jgi:DNA repair exonuclease SbcCD ATPase subunit